ncbi:hypothetical protein [Haloarcula marina]|uniref:hypothetical protein n=1 Tax=Haloarcula marina TaxID=2961574 RepID=UPI0020B6BB67|nr:hypothetical protein [Halomicroarcula marina]
MPRTTTADNGTDADDRDAELAEQLGMDIGQDEPDVETIIPLLEQLEGEVSPLLSSVLEGLVATIDRLQDRVDELEVQQEATHDVATTAVGEAATNHARLEELEDDHEETRDIARSATAKVEQATADPDHQEDAESLPAGVEPSSSPLDFFANCRETKIKELFVEQSNRQNTYRAIRIAKRWKEFATERTDGSGVFFTREDLTMALTAELGKEPHRQTVKRVWEKLRKLGGSDLVEKTRQVSRSQEPTDILALQRETAERLLEKRYLGLDLLDGTGGKATTGGVTPVVTGAGD